MSQFDLKITSPDGSLFDGKVSCLFVRGAEGDLAILAGHIPFITTIKPCECKVLFDDGSERSGRTESGMLSVAENKATLLSSSFKWNK